MKSKFKRPEIKSMIEDCIKSGASKTETFNQLSIIGVKEKTLAYLIASRIDPSRCEANKWRIRIMIAIAVVQLILGCLIGFTTIAQVSPRAAIITLAFCFAFGMLFVIGFAKNNVGAYHATLILTITQAPNQLHDITKAPIATIIGFLISLGLYVYTWDLRKRLFPDFAFLRPKKIEGKYVFMD